MGWGHFFRYGFGWHTERAAQCFVYVHLLSNISRFFRLLSVHSLQRTDINCRHIMSEWVYSGVLQCRACVRMRRGGKNPPFWADRIKWRCVSGTRKSCFALARAKFEVAVVWRVGMAEHYSKSKLKRKKSCVEKQNPEVSCKDTASMGRPALSSGDMTADSGGWVCSSQRQLPSHSSSLRFKTSKLKTRARDCKCCFTCSQRLLYSRQNLVYNGNTCMVSCSSAPVQNKHSISEDVL